MLLTARAYAWTIWRRHHWGLLLVAGYLVLAATASAVLSTQVSTQTAPRIFGPMFLLLGWPLFYLLGIFSYGMDAVDVIARESCFPAKLFTLPVRTGTLVGWPIAYGAAAVALLWFIAVWLVIRPWLGHLGVEAFPMWWPALLVVASLAWLQALLWSGVALPGLRIFLVIILINGMAAAPQLSAASGASESLLAGLFAALALAGWTVAYAGVRQARRGDVPNWTGFFTPFARLIRRLPGSRRPFSSAARAQTWYEWRRGGISLPIMTGLVLPFVLLFLAFGENDVVPTAQPLLGSLAVPVFLAGIAGMTFGARNRWVKDILHSLPPHTATLPITTAGMVGAKLKAAAWSSLAAWAVVALALPAALMLTGKHGEAVAMGRDILGEHHPVKVAMAILAAAALLFVATWKRLVDSLLIGMTGRRWVINGAFTIGMMAIFALCMIGAWVHKNPEMHKPFLTALPWILGTLTLLRFPAAGWALRRAVQRGILNSRSALHWVATWFLLASGLFGILAWIVPSELVPRYYLAFGVLLALPMVRLAATPLALAWNRHR